MTCVHTAQVVEVLAAEKVSTFEDCIEWARLKFQDYFHNRVAQLVFTFPEDAVTSTGSPFWSAPKRFPRPLDFDGSDMSHASFVQVSSNGAVGLCVVLLYDVIHVHVYFAAPCA